MVRDVKIDGLDEWIVISDLDGTIIDSESANFKALNQLLVEFGLTGHKDLILKGLAEGRDFKEIISDIDLKEEVKSKMERRMISLLTQAPTPSLPGAVDNLRFLWGLGILFGMATDNLSKFTAKVIQDLGIEEVFDSRLILTSDTYHYRKPSARVVSEILSRSGRSRAIIVGNTPKEVALAKATGCPAVIINHGKGSGEGSSKKKTIFEYEWASHGDIIGNEIYIVEDWGGVSRAIVDIIKFGGGSNHDNAE